MANIEKSRGDVRYWEEELRIRQRALDQTLGKAEVERRAVDEATRTLDDRRRTLRNDEESEMRKAA